MSTAPYIHRMLVFGGWSASDWFGLAGLIVALVAAAVAATLVCFEVRRYRVPLQMRVREVDIAARAEDKFYLILLRIAFVNPATRGRTVYHIAVHQSDEVHVEQPPHEYSKRRDEITYKLPAMQGAQGGDVTLSLDEVLQLPLDIPPHQSRYLWWPAEMKLQTAQPDPGTTKFQLTLDALDVTGHRLARFDEEIELQTYMIS